MELDGRYVDMEAGLGRVRGNKKLYLRMLKMYLDGTEGAQLEAALATGDTGQAADVAHAIKGIAGNLSFPALFEASTQLMEGLRQGNHDPADVAAFKTAQEKTHAMVTSLVAELEEEMG
ncbi:Hpt domain-containing protein [Eubacteriales bacterium OttesenSCG-928-M02]|nr:Hpt domain-containing protein [Eubacteriales bacterium OttesenSCG-928-M02]